MFENGRESKIETFLCPHRMTEDLQYPESNLAGEPLEQRQTTGLFLLSNAYQGHKLDR